MPMPFILSSDMCIDFSWTRICLLDCAQVPAVRELKPKDRIEVSTLSSIKLPFQIAEFEAVRGVVQQLRVDASAVIRAHRLCLQEIEARRGRAQQAKTSAISGRYHIRRHVRRTVCMMRCG